MIAGLHVGTELKRFRRSTLGRIAILAVSLMPLMYSALYLWAFWNPFGMVDNLPIAFVNADKGTTVAGKPLHAGDQIVEELKHNDQVNFHFVSEQDALDGVKDGRYYFVVELTPDFSEAVASPTGDAPRKAVIKTVYNDTNGYLSTLIGENVMRTMLPVISNSIGEKAVDQVLVGIQKAGNGLTLAADGATKLHDGSVQLKDGLDKADAGATKLQQGLATVDGKVDELSEGAHKVADGTQTLVGKIDEATGKLTQLTQGVDQLHGGVNQLADGATAIDNGVAGIKAQLDRVTATQATSATQLRNLAAQIRAIPDPNATRLAGQLEATAAQLDTQALGPNSPVTAQLNQLAGGTHQLAYQLSDPSAPFRSGFDQLHSGTSQLPGQLGQLQAGVNKLNDGAHKVADGTVRLKTKGIDPLLEGSDKLVVGLNQLADGSVKLADGSNELATKLTEGSTAVPQWSTEQREHTASVLGGPVALDQSNEAGHNTFGAGLAPFFFSLAMFIGGLIIFLLLNPLQRRAIASGVSPLRAALDGFLPGAIIATVQASVIIAVTLFAVGLHAVYPIGLLCFAILVSVMFTAINQFLNVLLGPGPGKVAAMALLMLQILASGGLYPVETEPKVFSWLHPINPMTYSVNGFRQLIYGNVDHRLPQAVIAVLIILALSLTLTTLGAARDRTWTMKRLHPPIKI